MTPPLRATSTGRRQFLSASLGIGCACLLPTAAPAAAAASRPLAVGPPPSRGVYLVMLGTQGGPIPGRRAATASALVVDGAIYLIDAGSGLPLRFSEAGLDFKSTRALFITHLHSDHVADAFNFFSLNWTNWNFPRQQVQVFGPGRASANGPAGSTSPGLPEQPYAPLVRPALSTPGTEDFFNFSISASAYDINERLRSTRRSNGRPMDITGTGSDPLMVPHDIEVPSVANVENPTPRIDPIPIYEDDRVRVTAMLVEHPPVFPAFAYRFETTSLTLVFSGDTTPNENSRRFAQGADILVNEVMDIDAATARFAGTPLYDTMRIQFTSAHTPSRDWTNPATGAVKPGVGRFATTCDVHALVLNHIYPDSVDDATFHHDARKQFNGPVLVSEDLMVIDAAHLLRTR